MHVIFQVLPHRLEPEIITHNGFQNLSDLDRVDIYPVTQECNAKAVFDLMIKDVYSR